MLVNGKRGADWHPVQAKDAKSGFARRDSQFRNWVTADGRADPTGEGGFPAEAGRYHLYVTSADLSVGIANTDRTRAAKDDGVPVILRRLASLATSGSRIDAQVE